MKILDMNHKILWQDPTQTSLKGADLQGVNLDGANLQGVNLRGASLRDASLRSARLSRAELTETSFRFADLRGARLGYANLRYTSLYAAVLDGADLVGADLRNTDLKYACLHSADLRFANLRNADLEDADIQGAVLPAFQICPSEGSFHAYKKVCVNGNRHLAIILQLLIPSYARRTSSLVGRKCRASHAYVLRAFETNHTTFTSRHNVQFLYEVGEEVHEPDYDDDIRVECTRGIHFFMTREEAEEYRI